MLELNRNTLIGKGLHRECFIHPGNPALCVKVVVAGNSNENRREAKYYRQLARRGVSWEMLSKFHGLVATNLGEGAMFDLVRDGDGQVSKPLAHYLESETLSALHGDTLAGAVEELRTYLLRNRIITMTLKTKNILFQQDTRNSGRLVIVDNIGNSDFIPIANYSAVLARRKIRRKWLRFEADIRSQYSSNGSLGKIGG
jgi:PhoP regulatory network protein YrbL